MAEGDLILNTKQSRYVKKKKIYIYIYIYIAIVQLQLEASYPVHGIERISVVLSVSFFTISLKGVCVAISVSL